MNTISVDISIPAKAISIRTRPNQRALNKWMLLCVEYISIIGFKKYSDLLVFKPVLFVCLFVSNLRALLLGSNVEHLKGVVK